MDKDFMVCTDSSNQGLGSFIMQEGGVIYYASHKLNPHEEQYATHDIELEEVLPTLKLWRHYLAGRISTLKIDHQSFKYIFTQRDLNAR